MSTPVKPIPEHLTSITAGLNFHDCAGAIEFYKKAFNAEILYTMPDPSGSGKIMHGEMKIGTAVVMICDEAPDWNANSPHTTGSCPLSLNLYTEDCDALHQQALDAGAKEERPPVDYPWGERASALTDPYGYRWCIATHIEDVSPEEVNERMKTWQP